MDAENTRSPDLIASFDKGLSILDYLVHSECPLRLQDVADHIRIDKSSALRFLRTLERHSLVERHPRNKTYSVGTRLIMWSKNLKAGNAIVEIARPFLKRLTVMTRETSHLAVLRDDRVALIEVMPSENAVSVRQTPGDWEPLYCSAVGKAILAFLPMIEQRKLIGQMNFREFTPKTINSTEMLRVELRAVMHDRIAFDDGETNSQMGCIAAPILDRMGYPVASLGLSIISALHPGPLRSKTALVDAVKTVANETITAMLKP